MRIMCGQTTSPKNHKESVSQKRKNAEIKRISIPRMMKVPMRISMMAAPRTKKMWFEAENLVEVIFFDGEKPKIVVNDFRVSRSEDERHAETDANNQKPVLGKFFADFKNLYAQKKNNNLAEIIRIREHIPPVSINSIAEKTESDKSRPPCPKIENHQESDDDKSESDGGNKNPVSRSKRQFRPIACLIIGRREKRNADRDATYRRRVFFYSR